MVEVSPERSVGAIVAQTLATSWREKVDEFTGSAEDLEQVAPLLLDSGAGAITWRRLKHSPISKSRTVLELQQAYRLHTLNAAVNEHEIERVIARMTHAGVEALLVKGWAVARLYPEAGLRPYGDIDLVVSPQQFEKAANVLAEFKTSVPVDLHNGASTLASARLSEIYARSESVRLNGVVVRIPCAEEHLQMLCVHFLRHGACRPLSLCDVAVAIESRPADFDWNLCLGEEPRSAKWVASAIELAVQMLGARPEGIPDAARMKEFPRWFVPAVLRQWGIPLARTAARQPPMKAYFRHPLGIFRALRIRWPNPIEATIGIGGALSNAPRLPFQIASCAARTLAFITRS